ncbi:MAG: rfbB [Eubacterium sp.]|jgi:dTDP-glucose 4,6-dehydratase|nr:rfbB [Eubacterium sp.]
MKVLLVTGGAGFIGSNFIKYFMDTYKDFVVVNYDKLTYAGNLNNLTNVAENPGYYFVKGDICDSDQFNKTLSEYNPDYIINFAAESHVDRSIDGPSVFGRTNFMGTLNLLECVQNFWGKSNYVGKRFLQISTDEVYGSLENNSDYFTENSELLPNSPYSASKAGADLLVRSFFRTYGLPVIITRCCNNYGPYQYSEKFIPTCISKALKGLPIPIYGTGTNIREWIHVQDHCSAIIKALFTGTPGEIYNIGSGEELSNIDMARMILNILGKSQDSIVYVNDRPGHDNRYALDSSRARNELGWSGSYNLNKGLLETVLWYRDNKSWWEG